MKKNKIFRMLAVVVALSLFLMGCPNGTTEEPYTGPKSIKITGFNVENAEKLFVFINEQPSWSYPPVTGGRTNISGSDITVELKDGTDTVDGDPWTGTGKYYIWISVQHPAPEKRSMYLYTTDGVPQVATNDNPDDLYNIYNIEGITNIESVEIHTAITVLDFTKFVYRGKHPTAG